MVADTAGDEQRMLADVATVVSALPADVVAQTTQVTASTIDHIVIELADGRQIVWGNASLSGREGGPAAGAAGPAGHGFRCIGARASGNPLNSGPKASTCT